MRLKSQNIQHARRCALRGVYRSSGTEWVHATRQGPKQPRQPQYRVWGFAGQPFARVQGSRAIHQALGEKTGKQGGSSS